MKTKVKKTLAMLMSLVMIIACYVPLLGALGIEANAAAVLSGLLWPVPTSYSITKDRYFSSSHDGIDIEYCAKHNIVAAYDGKVVKYINKCQHISAYCQSCDENWFGVGLILEHTINGTKYYTHYAHMQYNSIPAKYSTVGATVKKGDVIGKVGSSGFSGGYHLHFAVYKNSAFGTAVCTTPTDSRHNYTSANGVSYTYSASTTKLYWPVPGHTILSQGFHDGTSISIGDSSISGATVIAAIGGKVTHIFSCNKNHDGTFECSNNCNGFGTGLVIEGTDGRIYQYAHLQYGSIPSEIKVGSTVSDAQIIGKVGNTGYISGNALEFGITVGNYYTPSGYDPSKESYIYTEAEKKLTVTYNINGGYIDSTEYKAVDNIVYKSDGTKINHVWTYNKTQTYGLWDAATFGLKKDGYTFLGWGTKPTGYDGKIFDDKNTALLPSEINPNVANGSCSTTLYALWVSDTYSCVDSVIDTNTGHKYIYFNATVSWSDAKDYSDEIGGYLATITSKSENDLIASLLESDSRVWLGGSDANEEGTWTWVTGEPFNYNNWADSEPSNSSGCEHYMEYWVEKSGWNDAPDYSGNNTGFVVETQLEECRITLDPNGGDGGSDYITQWESESVTLSEVPTRDGYTFFGWSTDKNATTPEYRQGDIYLVYSSVTFYAVWQADHVCSYNYFVNYMAEHPHYAVYRCTCGETRVDYGLTSTFDNCTECNPNPYPVVNVIIKNPSVTTINYGDSITLHADFEGTLPEGAKIVWEPSNDNFSYEVSADGKACKISPASSGDTTFTARVVDADGKLLAEPDTQTMTSKAGFFLKLIAFIKGIFGLTKDIPQVFKAVS